MRVLLEACREPTPAGQPVRMLHDGALLIGWTVTYCYAGEAMKRHCRLGLLPLRPEHRIYITTGSYAQNDLDRCLYAFTRLHGRLHG